MAEPDTGRLGRTWSGPLPERPRSSASNGSMDSNHAPHAPPVPGANNLHHAWGAMMRNSYAQSPTGTFAWPRTANYLCKAVLSFLAPLCSCRDLRNGVLGVLQGMAMAGAGCTMEGSAAGWLWGQACRRRMPMGSMALSGMSRAAGWNTTAWTCQTASCTW